MPTFLYRLSILSLELLIYHISLLIRKNGTMTTKLSLLYKTYKYSQMFRRRDKKRVTEWSEVLFSNWICWRCYCRFILLSKATACCFALSGGRHMPGCRGQ